MIFTIPRYKKIFDEFGEKMPEVTRTLITFSMYFHSYTAVMPLINFALIVGISAFIAIPSLRWHTPLLGRLYRWGIQAEFLRSLG
jgi:type II secretory pathway component PulF